MTGLPEQEGEIAGISYRVRGAGAPLVLLPLDLSPGQWEPLIPELAARYCTITLSGALLGSDKIVFVPLARLKEEQDGLRVPYSSQHIDQCPEVEPSDEISAEDDRKLRDHYGIDRADHELRTDNDSYAERVPEGDEQPHKVSSESES